MEKKINIDDYAPIEILRKMTPSEIYDVIDRHIAEQKNEDEKNWTQVGRRSLLSETRSEKRKWQIAVDSLQTYAYWYGGACQNLD
jgi:hypothetical protein